MRFTTECADLWSADSEPHSKRENARTRWNFQASVTRGSVEGTFLAQQIYSVASSALIRSSSRRSRSRVIVA